jgi:outer membrane protein assembly factor BamA
MRWIALGVAAALAACASAPPRVHKAGDEYLATIRIEGNHAIDSDSLIPKLALHRVEEGQRAIDDYQLQLDTQRIITAYQKLGFFAVAVHPRIEKHGDADTLVFVVTEGPRATTHVVINGLPPEVPVAKARALVPLDEGGPFDYDAYDAARAALLQLVEDAGYARVQLDATVVADRTHGQATVEYVFDPGPLCTFGNVAIDGAEGMLADAVRARLAFHPGDHYSTTALLDTQQALYRFGRFSSVRVRPDRRGESTVIDVKISVARGDLNELRAGFGGGVDALTYYARLHATYSRAEVLTPLTTFTSDFRFDPAVERDNCGWDFWHCKFDPRIRLLGVLTQQDLLFTNVKGDVELGLDYLTIEAYTRVGGHARVGLAVPLGTPRLLLRVGWQYTYADFIEPTIQDTAAIGINSPDYVGAYTSALVIDLRDHPVEPQRGIYALLGVNKGTPYAGGNFDYWQINPDVRGFYTLFGTTLAARAHLGEILGDVPAIERYYAGGMSSQRGFDQRRLSPVDPATGIVIGGAAIVETSLELRHGLGSPFGIDLQGVVFVDGADVTRTPSELDVLNQYWAAGLGLRWLSPIGAVGFDFAYRLNRTDPGNAQAGSYHNLVFAIGEAF